MPITPPLISLVATGPLFVVGALVPAGPREAIWGLAAFIELAGPTALRGRLSGMHLDAAHLSERFGLFVLIALGESVVAIGVSAQAVDRFTVGVGGAVVAAFALSCGLWWVYFHFAADAMRHALATAEVQLHVTRLVLSYGHLAFISAIVLTAVGLHDVVSHPGEHLGWATAGMLVGGTALYLGTFGFTRWAMFRLVSTTRLTAAAAVLAFLPLAARLPGLVAVAILAVASAS